MKSHAKPTQKSVYPINLYPDGKNQLLPLTFVESQGFQHFTSHICSLQILEIPFSFYICVFNAIYKKMVHRITKYCIVETLDFGLEKFGA